MSTHTQTTHQEADQEADQDADHEAGEAERPEPETTHGLPDFLFHRVRELGPHQEGELACCASSRRSTSRSAAPPGRTCRAG